MLPRTFCHIKGIGLAVEKQLWEAGILSWTDFLLSDDSRKPPAARTSQVCAQVMESMRRFSSRDYQYFIECLKAEKLRGEICRVLPHVREQLIFIDLETTGLHTNSKIVSIASLDLATTSISAHVPLRSRNPFSVSPDAVIVTYNGASFDIPKLRRTYPAQPLANPHIDLRYVCDHLGLQGGQKAIERKLGLDRPAPLMDVDGSFVRTLYGLYLRRRESRYLETILAYNVEDIRQLVAMTNRIFEMVARRMPFAQRIAPLQLPIPPNPYAPCAHAIAECVELAAIEVRRAQDKQPTTNQQEVQGDVATNAAEEPRTRRQHWQM